MKKLDYSQKLQDFFNYYQRLVDKLRQEYLNEAEGSREGYMTRKLRSWLENEGYSLLYTTIEQLGNEANNKVQGFIDVYTFLLSNSTENALKLIDQLFFIPSQFAREFIKEQRTLIGEYTSNDIISGRNKEEKYTFISKGTFDKVSCFLGG